jgi:hypothetical protein
MYTGMHVCILADPTQQIFRSVLWHALSILHAQKQFVAGLLSHAEVESVGAA